MLLIANVINAFMENHIESHTIVQMIINLMWTDVGCIDKFELDYNAPHTMGVVCADTWDRPYTRQQAAFPMPVADKYWPTVSKIDDAFGDRNLVCVLEK